MKQWFIRFGREAVGPLTSAELRQLAHDGGLRPDSQVSSDGTSWFRADFLENLELQPKPKLEKPARREPTTKSQPAKSNPKKSSDFINAWPWWALSVALILGRLAYWGGQKYLPARPRPAAANSVKAAPVAAPTPEQIMAAATLQYWQAASTNLRTALAEATRQKNFAAMEPYLRQVDNLPVANVDPAVLPVVLEVSAGLRDSLQVNARSRDPMLFIEILARSKQGEQFKPGLQIREEELRVQKRLQVACASAIQMRALLSGHYGVEFPPLVD